MRARAAGLLLLALLVAGCGADGRTTVTVFAAASLTDAFQDAADAFEAAHPDARVQLSFAGSPTLVTQLREGARSDVLATADEPTMQTAVDGGLIAGQPRTFAGNALAILVPADNPAGIETLADLANDGVRLVLAGAEVPAGRYAREMLANASQIAELGPDFADRVLANAVSNEPNVKAVVTKVQLGEADAGIVYRTDLTAEIRQDVTLIGIPGDANVLTRYPIAVTDEARQPELARAFIDFLLSDQGQLILQRHGFLGAE